MRINRERVEKRLDELAAIGVDPGGGNTRLSFTAEDRQARELFCGWLEQCGAELRIDAIGNIIGRFPGSEKDLPAIALGSHLDTVPNGGRFDGVLGCLAALECAQILREEKRRLRHPLEVIVFVDEEGSRFGTGLLGSRAMLGTLTAEELHAARDREEISVWEAVRAFGLRPEKLAESARSRRELAAFLELHIEQGGSLEKEGVPVGVVTAIVGIKRYEISFQGEANHAGTTPFSLRKDALLAAARTIVAVREEAERLGNPATVATVGRIEARPGAINVVAGQVACSLEIRDVDEDMIARIGKAVESRCAEIGDAAGVRIAVEERGYIPPVPLDPGIIAAIEASSVELGTPCRRLPSGAGHDSQSLAKICPTGMIFIPSRSGISHAPEEYSSGEDIAAGIGVLLGTVLRIDGAGP
jgi:hydantoinase/carbamoylase family amidase